MDPIALRNAIHLREKETSVRQVSLRRLFNSIAALPFESRDTSNVLPGGGGKGDNDDAFSAAASSAAASSGGAGSKRKRKHASTVTTTPILVVSDIHGHLDALKSALDWFQSHLSPDDDYTVVLLGDFCDNGNQIPQLLNWIRTAHDNGWVHPQYPRFRLRPVIGNHDMACLLSVKPRVFRTEYSPDQWWKRWGAFWNHHEGTPYAYRTRTREAFAENFPHTEMIESLPWYHAEGGYVFVHAGLKTGESHETQLAYLDRKDLSVQKEEYQTYRYAQYKTRYGMPDHIANKEWARTNDPAWGCIVVTGHNKYPNGLNFVASHRLGLHSGSCRGDPIHCAILPRNVATMPAGRRLKSSSTFKIFDFTPAASHSAKGKRRKRSSDDDYFMTQNTTPEQITTCVVCAINNSLGRRLLGRSAPFRAVMGQLEEIQHRVRGEEEMTDVTKNHLCYEIVSLTNGVIRCKDHETLKSVVDRAITYMQKERRYGPHGGRDINLSLEKKGFYEESFADILRRAGLRTHNADVFEHDMVSMNDIEQELVALRKVTDLPLQGFKYSTMSRKFPGYHHGIAFRKIKGRWMMLDSEQSRPEKPPELLEWTSMTFIVPKSFTERFPKPPKPESPISLLDDSDDSSSDTE